MKAPIVISAWKLLVATAEIGTISGAAAKLGLSLPKASRLWAELEDLTGVALLDRTVKPARLTEEACRRLPDALLFLAAYHRLLSTPTASDTRPLRVSIPANAAPLPVLTVLNRFEADHGVQIDLLNDCGVEGLLSGRADVAWFGFEPPKNSGLTARRANTLFSFLMATPAYLKRCGTPKTTEELQQHTILMRDTANRSYDEVLINGEATCVLDSRFRRRRESAEVCRARLLAGEGIAIDLTPGLMMNELASGTVVPVLPGWHRRPWPIVIAALKEKLANPTIAALSEALTDCARHVEGMNNWRFWYRRLHLPMPVQEQGATNKKSKEVS